MPTPAVLRKTVESGRIFNRFEKKSVETR